MRTLAGVNHEMTLQRGVLHKTFPTCGADMRTFAGVSHAVPFQCVAIGEGGSTLWTHQRLIAMGPAMHLEVGLVVETLPAIFANKRLDASVNLAVPLPSTPLGESLLAH